MTNLLALPSGTCSPMITGSSACSVQAASASPISPRRHRSRASSRSKNIFRPTMPPATARSMPAPRSHDCAEDYPGASTASWRKRRRWPSSTIPISCASTATFAPTDGLHGPALRGGPELQRAGSSPLGRAPRQHELDRVIAPLLDALELIHNGADFLHRDIAPDNIIIRKDGSPVLIDFGSARGEIAQHSMTVSALMKPGYSAYEQYATNSRQQGPWSDIYSLGATLYQAVTGKRPPDAPSRMIADELIPARDAALSSYRPTFLAAIDKALVAGDHQPSEIRGRSGAPTCSTRKPQTAATPEPAVRDPAHVAASPATVPRSGRKLLFLNPVGHSFRGCSQSVFRLDATPTSQPRQSLRPKRSFRRSHGPSRSRGKGQDPEKARPTHRQPTSVRSRGRRHGGRSPSSY